MGGHFMAVVLGIIVVLFSWGCLEAQGGGLDACNDLPVWPAPATSISGDADGNARLELTDAVYLLSFLFQGGSPPAHLGCGEALSWWQNGDANGDWKLDLSDAVSLLGSLFLGGTPPVDSCDFPSPVFPPESRPYGLSYGEWTALWWRWQLCIPASSHPALGTAPCNVAQSQPVFFLAGAFSTEPVQRICSVPGDRPILLGIINGECSTLEPPPYDCTDEVTCLACTASFLSPEDELSCSINGVEVKDLHSFRFTSPFYHFTLPEDDVLGAEELEGWSAADGYYLLLPPQPSGSELRVKWFAKYADGPAKDFIQDITYTLIVE